MKKKPIKIRQWKIVCGMIAALCLLVTWILMAIADAKGTALADQSEGKRWSAQGDAAQISCFFSVASEMSKEQLEVVERQLDTKLVDAGVLLDSENPSARLYASSFSENGKISISSKRTNITVDALGVNGDFFLFHPLDMLSGDVFRGDDLNKDYVILDETSAWQLYGSSNIEGQLVYIGTQPLVVRGVYRQDESRLAKAAGLNNPLIFLSYETLEKFGTPYGLNSYEIVMPNPIKDFAKNAMTELLGNDQQNVEVIDSTDRFSLWSRIDVIRDFGKRSMNGKAIIYPYWENIARGVEDQVAALTLGAGVCLLAAVILILILILHWWYHKGWDLQDKLREIGKRLGELPGDLRDSIRRKRLQKAQEEKE